jgi:hypothetical protein
VQEVIGVHLGQAGTLQVAVVWANDNTVEGGTWIDIADLNVGFPADLDDGDEDTDGNENAPTSKAEEAKALDLSVQSHNWNLYFGQEVDEDLDIICGFAEGRHSTAYQGVLMIADYDEQTGCHQVHFPVMPASNLFGTAAQDQPADYINLRLDNLECPDGQQQQVKYWVKRDYVGLPFVQKKLPGLTIDGQPKETTKRKSRQSAVIANCTDGNHEQAQPRTKRMSKAQQETHEMIQQMRSAPL